MTANLTLTYGALNLTASPYAVEFGMDVGAPQNEADALAFLLQDGEIELSSRASNRTFVFTVQIDGASLTAMATAEAALVLETEKVLSTLSVDPGDGAPATVFDIYRGQVALARDDNGELSRLRRYTVTVRALPFGRSAAEVTATALPASGTTHTTLDTMGATTGWTGTVNGGAVTVTNTVGPPTTNSIASTSGSGTFVLSMLKTFAATTTTTKLLVIDWKSTLSGDGNSLAVIGDGVTLPLIAELASPTAGYVRSYFYVAASSLAAVQVTWTSGPTVFSLVRSLVLDNIEVTNAPPTTGTARQQMRSLTVSGSARAQGTLSIQSPTAALGNGTLVYTFPTAGSNGYSPSCRQYRVSGNTVTSDATMVSGSREGATALGIGFQIPYNLLPRGSYLLLARMGLPTGSETGTIVVTSSTVVGGTGLGTKTSTTSVSLSTTYSTFALTRIILPTVDVPDLTTVSSVLVNINSSGWSGAPTLDEAWLFNTTIGQLIWVDCGTGAGAVGGSARRLFVAPPNVTTPRPTLRIGHSADGSDSFYPSTTNAVRSWQNPVFQVPQTNVVFVTPNATDAVATLSYSPRWHTNAAS